MHLPGLALKQGGCAMVLHGATLAQNGVLQALRNSLSASGIEVFTALICGEPSVERLDGLVLEARGKNIQVVIGMGGGSVLDAAKALAALIPVSGRAAEYLEGVGTLQHPGTCLPWFAIPTTAGTGSEASSNAVLKGIGPDGIPYKRSLRHANFLPNAIILAPELALGTPLQITVACAMDAFSQLLESYTSTQASPLSDAVTFAGLQHMVRGMLALERNDLDSVDLRFDLGFGALCSGYGLGNAGLGLVHGFAGLIGAMREIPHGVVCATLITPCFRETLEWLQANPSASSSLAIHKLGMVGALFSQPGAVRSDILLAHDLIERLDTMVQGFGIARLGAYGFTGQDMELIAAQGSNRNSPAKVDLQTRQILLQSRC